ncbi:hypothetical protein CMO90_02045 [Candidatus Woesearchaeota archaeon]|nr:hypothetical protein [Candidatus Woesearchaeota archaeon]MDP6642211.1 radical SAM protein [Candidatus Nanoarchaeia archaeon]
MRNITRNRLIFPEKVMIQTSSFCNSDCIMCPYKETSKEVSQGQMDWKVFKKITNECKKNDVKRILLYLMNEPLMDKDIVKKINYAKRKNPKTIVHIVSNGSILNKKTSKKIIKSKLDYIELSVHGMTTKTYEKIMRGLDFKKTIKEITKFIELAKEYRKDENYINIKLLNVKNLLNKKEKEEAKKFWNDLGVKNVNYFEAPISRAGNIDWLKINLKKEVNGCNSIWRNEMIHILYNGDVVLCCMDWKRKNILGNVNKQSLNDIWNSEKYLKIEMMIKGEILSSEDFICKKCEESL